MKTKQTEQNTQLELPLGESAFPLVNARRGGKIARARWWFQAMHRVIDAAFDWGAHTQPRPEQGRLGLTSSLAEQFQWSYSSSNSR